jgi:hypothetical protein
VRTASALRVLRVRVRLSKMPYFRLRALRALRARGWRRCSNRLTRRTMAGGSGNRVHHVPRDGEPHDLVGRGTCRAKPVRSMHRTCWAKPVRTCTYVTYMAFPCQEVTSEVRGNSALLARPFARQGVSFWRKRCAFLSGIRVEGPQTGSKTPRSYQIFGSPCAAGELASPSFHHIRLHVGRRR